MLKLLLPLVLVTACYSAAPRIPHYASPRTALLTLDLQRDFLEDSGRLPVAASQRRTLIAANNRVLAAAVAHDVLVVHIRSAFSADDTIANWWRNDATIAGQPGGALDPRLLSVAAREFNKDSSDAFDNPALDTWLREHQVEHLIVTGVYANHCVAATVDGARARGYRVTVPEDAVAAADDEAVASGLREMQDAGAVLTSSAGVVEALSKKL